MIATDKKIVETLQEGGAELGRILSLLREMVRPGITTKELDTFAEQEIRNFGGRPSFKGYTSGGLSPYPGTVCTSINDEVVHGIPSERKLEQGDIIGLDIGMEYKGYFTDTAITVPVGNISAEVQKLIAVTTEGLYAGITAARPGNTIGDIGHAIAAVAKPHKYGIVRELVGHGVGAAVHEDPQIPNYGKQGSGEDIVEGMVLALEPMFTLGKDEVILLDDGWTWATADGSISAHMEHTIYVGKDETIVITKGPAQ